MPFRGYTRKYIHTLHFEQIFELKFNIHLLPYIPHSIVGEETKLGDFILYGTLYEVYDFQLLFWFDTRQIKYGLASIHYHS